MEIRRRRLVPVVVVAALAALLGSVPDAGASTAPAVTPASARSTPPAPRPAAEPAATASSKTLLQVDGAPATVHADEPGQDGEVVFTGAAGQTVTVDLLATGFEDPCDVHVTLKTPAGDTLAGPTCAGDAEGTLLHPVAVKATALLHLLVDLDDDATGTVSVHVTGKGTASITPNAGIRRVTVAPRGHAVLAFGAQQGDVIGVDIGPHVAEQPLHNVVAQLLRGSTSVSGDQVAGPDGRMVWAYPPPNDAELRLSLVNYDRDPIELDVRVTSRTQRSVALRPGIPTVVGLHAPGRTTTLTFAGTAGSRPQIDLVSTVEFREHFTGISLVDPEGHGRHVWTLLEKARLLQLPQLDLSGTWKLVLHGEDADGRVTFTLREGSTAPGPVTFGDPVPVSFSRDGEVTEFVVDAVRDDTLTVEISDFDVTTAEGAPAPVTLSGRRPGDEDLQRWDSFDEDVVLDAPAPAPGTQQRVLRFTTVAGAHGTFTMTVTRTPATAQPLVLGTPVTLDVTDATPSGFYSFPVAAGQLPVVTVTAIDLEDAAGDAGLFAASGTVRGQRQGRTFGATNQKGQLRAAREVVTGGTFLLRVGAPRHGRGRVTFVVTVAKVTTISPALGEDVTLDLSDPEAVPRLSVPFAAGDLPFVELASPAGWTFGLGLFDDTGRRLGVFTTSDSTFFVLQRRVPAAGTYTLRPSGQGRVTLRVGVATTTSRGTLEEGKPVTLTSAGPLQSSTLTVPRPGATVPYLTLTEVSPDEDRFAIALRDAAGHDVEIRWEPDGDGKVFTPGPTRLPGPLTLVLTTFGAQKASITVALRYGHLTVRSMTIGEPLRIKVAQPVPEIRFSFDAQAGQSLVLYAESFRFRIDGRLTAVSVQLVRPGGKTMTDVFFDRRQSVQRLGRLDTTGRWTLRIKPGTATGVARVTPYLGVDRSADLPVNRDTTATFASPADTYRWTITAPANTGLSLPVVSAALAVQAPDLPGTPRAAITTKLCRNGSCIYQAGPITKDLAPLLPDALRFGQPTTITITLTPAGVTAGTVVLHPFSWALTGPSAAPLGKAFSATLVAPLRPADFQITVPEPGRYGVRLSGLDLDGAGTRAVRASVSMATGGGGPITDPAAPVQAGSELYNDVTLPHAGQLTLSIVGVGNTTGSLTVTIDRPRDLPFTTSTNVTAALTRPGDRAVVTLTAPPSPPADAAFTLTPVGEVTSDLDAQAVDAKGRRLCPNAARGPLWCEDPRIQVAYPVTITLRQRYGGTGTWAVRAMGTSPQRIHWTPGDVKTITIPPGSEGQDVDILVDAVPNARLALVVTDYSITTSTSTPEWPDTHLMQYDAEGRWVADEDVPGPGTYRADKTMPPSGTARMRLRTDRDATGSFTAGLFAVKDVTGAIAVDKPLTVTLDQPGMWGSYPLTVHRLRWYTVHATGSTFASWRVCWRTRMCTPPLGAGDTDVYLPIYERSKETQPLVVQPLGLSKGTVTLTVREASSPPPEPTP